MIDWARFWGFAPGDVIELQALGIRQGEYTLSLFAHATSPQQALELANFADNADERAAGIYTLVNAPNPVVATRDVPGRWHRAKKGESTTDLNMLTRRALYIDIDAERPSGTSATDEELSHALELATRVYADVVALVGPDACAKGLSGNGAAVLVALDNIPESPEVETTVKAILSTLAELYDTPAVAIDRKVFDAKRLCPAWGTTKRKGIPGLAERPHRVTGFSCSPTVRRIDLAELVHLEKMLAERLPSQPATAPRTRTGPGRVTPFSRANGVSPIEVATWLGIVDGSGITCPGCGESSGVAVLDRGFFCHHKRCAAKGKNGFRSNVDLVAEVKGVTPIEAVRLLSANFGLDALIVDYTESGFAEFIAATRADLRYVTSWAKWLAWDGVRWSSESGLEVASRAPKEIASQLFAQANLETDESKAKKLAGAATRLRARSTRESTMLLARWEAELALHHTALDRDAEHLLVTPNGTVDLRTGELTPNDPARLLTRATSTPYDMRATCPAWDRFVREVAADDPDLVGYLQRAVGYSLTGSTAEHVVFFLYGSGANGKTTFVETVCRVLGSYTSTLRSDALMAADHAQHPTVWAGLVGTRLAAASEIERGARLAESLIKSITGGDTISARRMREDFWSYTPQFKLWLLGNDKPVVRGVDEGVWRRIRLVPFTVSFIGRADTHLSARLMTEAPGILRWAVDGARAWYAGGLGDAAAISAATSTYRAEQDVFGLWAQDELEIDPARFAFASELRRSYEAWCAANGAYALGVREYAERLTRLGATAERGNRGRFWQGVGVKGQTPLRVVR